MTMHAAKGLEWDVVILPGLGRKTAVDPDPLLHWIELARVSEGTDLLLAPIRSGEQEPDGSLASYIKGLKRARGRLERVRLLYVAATRARTQVHLLAATGAGAGALHTRGAGGRFIAGNPLAGDRARRVPRPAGRRRRGTRGARTDAGVGRSACPRPGACPRRRRHPRPGACCCQHRLALTHLNTAG